MLLGGMELQLGLALPSNPMKGFDLNCYGYESKEVMGSDCLSHLGSCFSGEIGISKKRCFNQAFEQGIGVPQTLPLLVWNNQPHEDDDDQKDLEKDCDLVLNKNDGDGIVGWPPIKSWRKKLCYQNHGGLLHNHRMVADGCAGGGGGGGSKSMYVKVKVEGVAIARKVDLSLHRSYETLMDTLVDMFETCQENGKAYKLTYQDREGDWLLAGDVPWRSFSQSVQRLKIVRRKAD